MNTLQGLLKRVKKKLDHITSLLYSKLQYSGLIERDKMTVPSEAKQTNETTPKDFHEYLTGLIKQAVTAYLAQEKIQFDAEQLPIDLRFSAQSSFGDYSMPIMSWAGKNKLGRPPLPVAEALATILRIRAAPPSRRLPLPNQATSISA